MAGNCYKCGYFRKENNYCEYIDCTIDPFDRDCPYDRKK